MPNKLYTFRQLVDARYIAAGFSKFAAFAKVHGESGVSMSSLRAAYEGTAVVAQTAEDLGTWAFQVHRVELDQLALLKAPPKEARPARDAYVLALLRQALADNDVTVEAVQGALEAHMRKETV
jgi:hypothetical protein